MEKLLLIDGNSLVFRAFYATMGRVMKTSFGKHTNAVFGFANMINKAIEVTQPTHVLVAFDTGEKTFRHKQFEAYKGTRKKLPEELVEQFPLVREFLDAFPMPRLEVVGYEADDIIGTVVKKYPNIEIEILSSDKDLLQLITPQASVILMKKGLTEFKRMNPEEFRLEYNLEPRKIIDLKALMGDASDNIPGVPSVGEKTAKKLIETYQTLDVLYENVNDVKGKLHEKLVEFKDQAYMSYELATIYQDVPLELDFDTLKFSPDQDLLSAFYRKYELNSLARSITKQTENQTENEVIESSEFSMEWFKTENTLIADFEGDGGFNSVIKGFALSNGQLSTYVSMDSKLLSLFHMYLSNPVSKIVLNAKVLYHYALKKRIAVNGISQDFQIACFVHDSMLTTVDKVKDKFDLWHTNLDPQQQVLAFAKDIYNLNKEILDSIHKQSQDFLLNQIEMPLIPILAGCEFEGFDTEIEVLERIAERSQSELDRLSESIFTVVGHSFNINSPKQLAEVLYDEMGLPTTKKRSTAVEALQVLAAENPVIDLILEFRKYQKLLSTYAIGLQKYIGEDKKIHTVFNQTATQTGRLSSSEPNLQNISVRNEDTREIRKAFVAPKEHTIISVDYSQIELRVLAHLAKEPTLIHAFTHNIDIHTQTATDLFHVTHDQVTSEMRRRAKTVNFGIIYGISDFGLSQQLGIEVSEAKEIIERYFATYTNIHGYMESTISQCQAEGYVSTLYQRRREIPEINDRNYALREFGKRAAMNAPIQGTAADLIKLAMIEVDRKLKEANYQTKMILQVHDELIFVAPHQEVEAVTKDIVEAMENVAQLEVPLEVSVNTGLTWFEAK